MINFYALSLSAFHLLSGGVQHFELVQTDAGRINLDLGRRYLIHYAAIA